MPYASRSPCLSKQLWTQVRETTPTPGRTSCVRTARKGKKPDVHVGFFGIEPATWIPQGGVGRPLLHLFGVAEILNLVFRRIAFGLRRANRSAVLWRSVHRLQTCDTPECNSGLRLSTPGLNRYPLLVAAALLSCGHFGLLRADSQSKAKANVLRLTLPECVQQVVNYNQKLQIQALEYLVAHKKYNASKGIFEPSLVVSAEHVKNFRKTVAQQRISLGVAQFDERNNLYDAGVEVLTPTGAKVHIGYTLHDLANNLQQQILGGLKEYESFAGVSLTQPLLKDGGIAATMAAIRLAATDADIAYQTYRRQMITLLAHAEGSYWDLYDAQEQYQIMTQSVSIAQTLLEDYQVRLQTGKASQLDVMQAQAGVATREAKANEARQNLIEANNNLVAMFSDPSQATLRRVRVVDQPKVEPAHLNFDTAMTAAMELNPDYLSQRKQVQEEDIRLAYAKNQRWPQLDLKASYGLNGLGDSPSSSWSDITHGNYENWTVGVELRVPLLGGIKGRNEVSAAKIKKQEALLNLKHTEVDVANALDSAIFRLRNASQSVTNFQNVVSFNQHLLQTEFAQMKVGKTDSRRILEAEDDLAKARSALVDSQVAYEKAQVELAIIEGTTLQHWHLDISQPELRAMTSAAVRDGKWSGWGHDVYNPLTAHPLR